MSSASHAASGTWLAVPTSDNWNTAANWDPSNPGMGTDITNAGRTDLASAPATLVLRGANTGSNTISGVIGEFNPLSTLALSKEDAGTWILAASNAYTRGTYVNGGQLVIATNNALGTGAVSVTNGSLLVQDGVTVNNAIMVGVAAGYATNFAPTVLAGWDMNGLAANSATAPVSGGGTFSLPVTVLPTHNGGRNYSFLDGHVEFRTTPKDPKNLQPGEWPANF